MRRVALALRCLWPSVLLALALLGCAWASGGVGGGASAAPRLARGDRPDRDSLGKLEAPAPRAPVLGRGGRQRLPDAHEQDDAPTFTGSSAWTLAARQVGAAQISARCRAQRALAHRPRGPPHGIDAA